MIIPGLTDPVDWYLVKNDYVRVEINTQEPMADIEERLRFVAHLTAYGPRNEPAQIKIASEYFPKGACHDNIIDQFLKEVGEKMKEAL